ncbi:protein of unknown function [Cupriavidus neocaledonicus]|uniref:Uncharacterized protein n=1 Tax=Cupriavidus neocaledonicus TaxID=1040979 RepID=A0A375H996_9BURK|nr:protein of unknown function [Cupriavidus neocaledonicus]
MAVCQRLNDLEPVDLPHRHGNGSCWHDGLPRAGSRQAYASQTRTFELSQNRTLPLSCYMCVSHNVYYVKSWASLAGATEGARSNPGTPGRAASPAPLA